MSFLSAILLKSFDRLLTCSMISSCSLIYIYIYMIKFLYFYTKSYEFYHNHIQTRLLNIFDLEPLLIDELIISDKGHHFTNITIKIKLIINCIQKYMNTHIVFTDATIFINDARVCMLNDYINQYTQHDLVFADNNVNNDYNIGVMLIHCNQQTLQFFNDALNLMNTNQFNWDQKAINYLIKVNTKLIIGKFDLKIYCGYIFDNTHTNTYLIFKSFIHNINKTSNFNQRIELFYKNKMITKKEYDMFIIQ